MDYARLVQTAQRLIAKSGQKVIWRSAVDPVPADPAKPWLASASDASSDFDCMAVFLPMKSQRSPFLSMMKDAQDVPMGSVLVLIAGNNNFEPQINDVCLREDAFGNIETLSVFKSNTVRPAQTSVLHMIVMAR